MNPTAANVGETWGLGEQLSVLSLARIGWMCWLSLVFSGFDAEDVSLNRLNCFSTTRQRRRVLVAEEVMGVSKFLCVRRRGIFVRNCCFGNRTIRMRRVVRRFFRVQTYSAQVMWQWYWEKNLPDQEARTDGMHPKFEKTTDSKSGSGLNLHLRKVVSMVGNKGNLVRDVWWLWSKDWAVGCSDKFFIVEFKQKPLEGEWELKQDGQLFVFAFFSLHLDRSLGAPWQREPLGFWFNGRYLVDPASSHMLVSKIKPCMSKYSGLYCETANGSLNQL